MTIYSHPYSLRSYSSLGNLLDKALKVVKETHNADAFCNRLEDMALNAPEADNRINIHNAFANAIFHIILVMKRKAYLKKLLRIQMNQCKLQQQPLILDIKANSM